MGKQRIDYDSWSKEELIKEIRRVKDTEYGLVWHRDIPQEKLDILVNPDAQTPTEMFPNEVKGEPFPVLRGVPEKTIDTVKDKKFDLVIEGDNFHSLAVLNFTHQEGIDLIYIDPPYNTGNKDFVYNDSLQNDYVKQDDPFKHSKWLAFMEKRLKLSKKLLKQTGLICISIDDNEYAPLKMLCDEVFSEQNFIANVIVQSNPRGKQQMKIAATHEYLLVYARDINQVEVIDNLLTSDQRKEYNKTGEDGKKYREIGLRKRGAASRRHEVPNLYYPIYIDENSGEVALDKSRKFSAQALPVLSSGEDGRWRWGKEKFNFSKDRLIGRKVNSGRWDVFEKDYLEDDKTTKYKSVWIEKELNYENAKKELKEIFKGEAPFDYPKTTYLIKKILRLGAKKDAVVLDFMAGSGTTGHAVLALNEEDGGSRQYILCTNNENNICSEVCYPRLKNIIKGHNNTEGKEVKALAANLRYYTCDFVEAEPTDRNKRRLVNKSTEMLCVKENAYKVVQDTSEYKIFRGHTGVYLGIVFYEDAIDDYKKAITDLDGYFNSYVFTLGDDTYESHFEDMKEKVTLCAIPEVILKVYQEIFK